MHPVLNRLRRLLLVLGILAGFVWLCAPASGASKPETVWWRTPGAAVVGLEQHRCLLLLYNDGNAFVFTWRVSGTTLEVEDKSGRLSSTPTVQAAVRIGNTWLGHPAHPGERNLKAVGGSTLRAIELTQPVLPLLKSARRIAFHLPDIALHMPVDHGKMPALRRALHRCRSTIH